eukprot:CAMPEP_0117593194 /NCGR_PEP_ID=MMETSP0784-20121206/72495_1 /TAXON_ID=39447 /ORGANISM="" /LENGTH=36 /DNA_ID= /DNA_START= /DNA_END= /DNA_ORIENTATION=
MMVCQGILVWAPKALMACVSEAAELASPMAIPQKQG